MSTHLVDGYRFTIEQRARFGMCKWGCSGVDLPNGGYELGEPRGFDLQMMRGDGWLSWTYRGCLRKVLRSIRRDQRSCSWKQEARAA